MILSMSEQTMLFLTAVLFGACAGFLYDCIRIFRIVISHKNFFVQIEDFLYWLTAGLTLFWVMLWKNYGSIRGFLIWGAFIGMIVYFFSISRIFIAASMTIIRFIKKVLLFVFKIIMTPFLILFKILKRIFDYPFKIIKKILHKVLLDLKKTFLCVKLNMKRKFYLKKHIQKNEGVSHGKKQTREEKRKKIRRKQKEKQKK